MQIYYLLKNQKSSICFNSKNKYYNFMYLSIIIVPMKKVALLIAMTLVFTSCSLFDDAPVEEIETPNMEVTTEVEIPSTDEETNETLEEEITTDTPAIEENTEVPVLEVETETPSEISIIEELASGTEDEQLLNEVVNEITEIFELVEQNGGQ